MTGPRYDPVAEYLKSQQIDPVAEYLKNSEAPATTEEPSVFKRFIQGMSDVGKKARLDENKKYEPAFLTKFADKIAGMDSYKPNTNPTTAEKVGGVVGDMVQSAPLYMGIGGAVGMAGEALAAKATSPLLKTALSGIPTLGSNATKAEAVAKTIAAGIPQEVATGLIGTAIADPSQLDSPAKIVANAGMGAVSSVFRGLQAAKNFSSRIETAKTLPELKVIQEEIKEAAKVPIILQPSPSDLPDQLRAANRNTDAKIAAAQKAARESHFEMNELLNQKLNARAEELASSKLTGLDADSYNSKLDQAAILGLEKQLKNRLEIPSGGKGARPRELSYLQNEAGQSAGQNLNQHLLTAEELSSYYDKLSSFKPYKQRRLSATQVKLDKAAAKGFQYLDPRELYDIQTEMLGFAHELSKGFDKPNPLLDIRDVKSTKKAATLVEDNGLISTSTKLPENFSLANPQNNPLGLITSGKKSVTFQGNPVTTSLELPGSGVQSVKPYVPPSIQTDPIAVATTNKFNKIPPVALAPELQDIGKHIDFNNSNAKAARADQNYILNKFTDRLLYAGQDFTRPAELVSPEAYDALGKLSRIGVRKDQNIRNRISIPDGQGGYTEGPESIDHMLRALGSDPEKMHLMDIYARAKQTAAGEDTSSPWIGKTDGTKEVRYIEENHPDVAKAYNERWLPIAKAQVDMIKNSHLPIANESIDGMYAREAYASLGRAHWATSDATGSLKQRGTKSAEENVADFWENSVKNLESLTANIERADVIAHFAKERLRNPLLAEHIEIEERFEPHTDITAIIKRMPDNIPEITKRAFAEAMLQPLPGSREFNIKLNDKIVGVRLSKELANITDMISGSGVRTRVPDNAGLVERSLYGIGKAVQTSERHAAVAYSYYRDIFGAGPMYDFIEAKMNLGEGLDLIKRPWEIVTEPAKGFLANMKEGAEIRKLKAYGAGTGHTGKDPGYEDLGVTNQKLLERTKNMPSSYKAVHPQGLFFGLADDLANATRTAITLQQLKKGMSYSEAATLNNNIIGDPYKIGALMSGISRYVRFFNFPIQANARTIKSIMGTPVVRSLADGVEVGSAAKTAARGVATKGLLRSAQAIQMLSVPTAIVWYFQKDNPELREMRKDPIGRTNLLVRNPVTKTIYAMRKPFLYGAIYSTPVEVMLDRLYEEGDYDSIERIGKSLMTELMPNTVPFTANAVLPMYTGQTVSPFEGSRNIIPQSRSKLLPEDQSDGQVSQAAKSISKGTQALAEKLHTHTGISSAVVENVFKSFLIGPIYKRYSEADDYFFGDKNHKVAQFSSSSWIPGVKKVNPATAGIHYVMEFYDTVSKAQQVLGSIDSADKNGQTDRFLELNKKYGTRIGQYETLVDYKHDMDQISKDIWDTKLNEMWSPEQKLKEINRLVKYRISIAKEAMTVYNQVRTDK